MQRENHQLKAKRIQWDLTWSELEVREEISRVFEQILRGKEEEIDEELEVDHTKLPGTAIDLAQVREGNHRAEKLLPSEWAAFRDEHMV